MRSLTAVVVAALLLCACASGPDKTPNLKKWFNSDNSVAVQEVGRSNVCGTAGGESVVTVVPNLAAMEAWIAGRGVDLVNVSSQPYPQSPYAIVEFGQRPNSGYGLAISRDAGLNDGDLLLKATFFEPTQGRWSSAEPSSPCVVVTLPALEFSSVRLVDQTGKVRAGTEGAP